MKKVIIAVIILLLVACGVLAVLNFNNPPTDNIQIIAAIYPVGTTGESYCFTLYDDNTLITEKGVRTETDDITHNPFISDVEKSKSKTLSDSEVSEIIASADKAIQSDYKMVYWTDSWNIQVLYKGKTIMYDCWNDVPQELEILMNKFIELSPIEVDIHGWA